MPGERPGPSEDERDGGEGTSFWTDKKLPEEGPGEDDRPREGTYYDKDGEGGAGERAEGPEGGGEGGSEG